MLIAIAQAPMQNRSMGDYKEMALAYLRGVIETTGKSASQLASMAGVSSTTFTRPLNDAAFKYAPKYPALAKVSELTGIALPAELLSAEPMPSVPELVELPIRYEVAAGGWEHQDDVREGPLGFDLANRVPAYDGVPQWLERVVGDSYNRKIPDGYLVHVVDAIAIEYQPANGDTVIVRRTRAQGSFVERSLKEVMLTPFGVELWPRSFDPKFDQPLTYRPDANETDDVCVEIVGKVIRAYQAFSAG